VDTPAARRKAELVESWSRSWPDRPLDAVQVGGGRDQVSTSPKLRLIIRKTRNSWLRTQSAINNAYGPAPILGERKGKTGGE